jgi:hypothetical protein
MSDNQSENAAVCFVPDTNHLPSSAYKDGNLTLAGYMMTVESCPRTFENALSGRTPQMKEWCKAVLSQWRELGHPSLGEWPPQRIGLGLVDFACGVMLGVLMANDPSSATRPTGRYDCNRDAQAGFAAAHG